ncbi:hypothetical protein MLD38_012703 [Melastoma candidum]|uniref:Uncharacterized protein n=1 Tax=Melastoma candidum TaxID=119954 RepID=A0ACB9R762_9MYRT|nr:hypothetical protein MLD38_012703 [Melastoma candidum]
MMMRIRYAETLLALAKLDFNSLQKLHQKEACDLVRWAKDHEFTGNMPFARDRIVECYLWALVAYYEPEFSFARRFVAKIVAVINLMDDMFDAYGTLEELELFTQALERWDMTATDGLPEYMKFYYKALLYIFDEIEEEVARRGHSYRLDYAKQSIKDHAKVYLKEVKWFHQRYIPPIDEYVDLASKTIGAIMIVMNTLVGMGDVVTEGEFKWLSSNTHVLQSYTAACRFSDDIAGYKFEQERGHVALSIHCLVKQYGCTEQEAEAILKRKIFDAWKDLNEACLRPLAVPLTVLERLLNWLRSASVMYDGNADNFTQVTDMMTEVVTAVLVNPFPL